MTLLRSLGLGAMLGLFVFSAYAVGWFIIDALQKIFTWPALIVASAFAGMVAGAVHWVRGGSLNGSPPNRQVAASPNAPTWMECSCRDCGELRQVYFSGGGKT